MKLRPQLGEDATKFFRRRMREARDVQIRIGMWGVRWARQLVKWMAHVGRDRNQVWAKQLLGIRPASELQ